MEVADLISALKFCVQHFSAHDIVTSFFSLFQILLESILFPIHDKGDHSEAH